MEHWSARGQRVVALVPTYPLFLFILLSPLLYILSLLPDRKPSFVAGGRKGLGGTGSRWGLGVGDTGMIGRVQQ